MKTLYLAQRIPYPPNKGEKIRTFHQIEYLLKNGHEVFLCCPYSTDDELPLFNQLNEKYGVTTSTFKLGPALFRYLSGLISHQPLSVSNFYSTGLQKLIDHLIATESMQNIVCTSSGMAQYVFNSSALAQAKNRPRLVMDFMDLDSDKWRQYSDSSLPPMKWVYQREARLLSRYEQRINNEFDASFFISQAEVDLFCQNADCAKMPFAIGNGMESDFFSPATNPPQNDAPVFIFTGVMDYKPNVDAVLWFSSNVWPKIINKYPGSRFIVAGMNPVESVVGLKKVDGIQVTGFVDDILPFYHQSDFFVAPLRIARGVQNKVLQAFSCGLPVISTSMGAEGIDYTEGENILIADTPEAFFNHIEKLIDDKDLCRSLKQNARELIENHYAWDVKLAQLGKILG